MAGIDDSDRSPLMLESETVCQPCIVDGKQTKAEAYCRDCCEDLCGQCRIQHNKFSSMKHHQLVNIGRQEDLKVRDVCAEECPEHNEEITKYFCFDHNALACFVCANLDHKRCERMDYIPDIVTDLQDSDHYNEFTAMTEALAINAQDIVRKAHESTNSLPSCYSYVMEDLDVYRDELIDIVERRIQGMREQARQILAQNMDRVKELATLGNKALAELESIKFDLKRLLTRKHFCKMFVEMKRNEKTLRELQEKIDSLTGAELTVLAFTFQPDEIFRKTLDENGGIGKIEIIKGGYTCRSDKAAVVKTSKNQQKKATCLHLTDIYVKSSDNFDICNIKGMALMSQNMLVVADYGNKTIKLIDTMNNKIIAELSPEEAPWDVTVCKDTIAATLPYASKIVFLRSDSGLEYERDIRVKGDCLGIDYYDDHLYVVFGHRQMLEVMTTTGVVLQSFTTVKTGGPLFGKPEYVTVSSANKRIFVSDQNIGQIMVFDMDGKQTGVYEDDEFWSPTQLAIDETGMMYLCDHMNDAVHLLSPVGDKTKMIHTSQDGMFEAGPFSVCYCTNTLRLYVGMGSDSVKVYRKNDLETTRASISHSLGDIITHLEDK